MKRMLRSALRLVALCLAVLLAACSDGNEQVTQVVVELNAEPSVKQLLERLHVQVYDVEAPASPEQPRMVSEHSFQLGALQLPFSFGVERHRADRFLMVVTGYANEELVIEHKTQISFANDQTRLATLLLPAACLRKGCSLPSSNDWFVNTCQLSGMCNRTSATATTPTVDADAGNDSSTPSQFDGGLGSDGAIVATDGAVVAMDGGITSDGGPTRDGGSDAALEEVVCHKFLASDGGAPFLVPANSEIHPSFTFDAPWGDQPVHAVSLKPIVDKSTVLYKWFLYEGTSTLPGSSAPLAMWGPGMTPPPMPSHVGLYLPSGKASLRLNMHYKNATTSSVSDQSGVEICVTKSLRANTAAFMARGPVTIFGPAGQSYEARQTCTLQTQNPLYFVGTVPMMHGRGQRGQLTVNGTSLWNDTYSRLSQPFVTLFQSVANGDSLTVSCTYASSSTSFSFGDDANDEMCFQFIAYYPRGPVTCTPSAGTSN